MLHLDTAADDWAKQVDNINFLDGVADDLAQFGRDANGEIDDFFGTDEFQDTEYNGMRIGDVLRQLMQLLVGMLLVN